MSTASMGSSSETVDSLAASSSAMGRRRLERHVGGVDRVGLAVDQGDPHVHDRVAGEHALLELGSRALLHRGDELARHGAAHHLVDELDPGSALQRLDLEAGTRHTARARRTA